VIQGFVDPSRIEWLAIGGCAAMLFLLVVVRMGGLVRQVHRLAMRDDLTGLANRRALEERIRAEGDAHVALIDLDDFKAVNDRLGHGVGDRLLAAVAARLAAVVRPGDTVARLDGDEFAVLMPRTPAEAADRLVAGIVASLASPLTVGSHRLLMRASSGVADNLGTSDPFEPLRRADIAMYAAKVNRGVTCGTRRRWTSARRSTRSSALSCGRGWTRGSSSWCTSRSWSSPRAAWRPWRRWCAAGTRCAAWSARPISSRSPSTTA